MYKRVLISLCLTSPTQRDGKKVLTTLSTIHCSGVTTVSAGGLSSGFRGFTVAGAIHRMLGEYAIASNFSVFAKRYASGSNGLSEYIARFEGHSFLRSERDKRQRRN